MNVADIVVLSIIIGICALIVRGMLRGSIRTCDPASCSGNCGSCGTQCATPRLRLTKEQMAQLDALDQKEQQA